MTKPSFNVHAEQTIEELMESMTQVEALDDFDMDIIGGVFTVDFEDGTKIIVNRQEPLEQLWLASPEGPAHFDYNDDAGEWQNDKTGESLVATLERVLSKKLGQPISL